MLIPGTDRLLQTDKSSYREPVYMAEDLFVRNSYQQYLSVEAVTWGISTFVVFAASAIIFAAYYCMQCKKCRRNKGCISPSLDWGIGCGVHRCTKKQACSCRICNSTDAPVPNRHQEQTSWAIWESLHKMLSVVFPGLSTTVKQESRVNEQHRPEYLMHRKILLFDSREIPENNCKRVHIYVFFILMALISFLMVIVTLVENVLYRKSTACNDVNVKVSQYLCFDLNSFPKRYNVVDCSDPKIDQDLSVVCYQYKPSFAAVGIAFGVFRTFSLLADVELRVVIKLANYPCGRIFLLGTQIVSLFIYPLVFFVSFPLTTISDEWNETLIEENYFFQGVIPMRIATAILVAAAITVGTFIVPWNYFQTHDQENIEEYYFLVKKEKDPLAVNGHNDRPVQDHLDGDMAQDTNGGGVGGNTSDDSSSNGGGTGADMERST